MTKRSVELTVRIVPCTPDRAFAWRDGMRALAGLVIRKMAIETPWQETPRWGVSTPTMDPLLVEHVGDDVELLA